VEGSGGILVTHFVKEGHMFWVNSILEIELVITIGIPISHDTIGFFHNISTSPGKFAYFTFIWVVTVKMFRIWAVFISPGVFDIDNTSVDFTLLDGSIIVIITIFNKDI
jgi:hypothetical protein